MKSANSIKLYAFFSFLGASAIALHPNANDPIVHCTHMTLEKCMKIKQKPSKCFDTQSMLHAIKRNAVPICDDRDLVHLCYCSCFHPDTKILASIDGSTVLDWHPISALARFKDSTRVAVLNNSTTIRAPSWNPSHVEQWIRSDEAHEMIEIKTDFGREITLTGLHALLTSTGTLKLAQDVKMGDTLVGYDGRLESVVSVRTVVSEKGILNLLTSEDSNQGHLIVANGLIVGDIAWENWLLGKISEPQVPQE